MQTIAAVARKGGAGKTTLAVHLAIAGYLRAIKTLLADADPLRSASGALKGRTVPGPKLVETNGPKLFALQDMARRAGHELLVIDTPCGPEQDVAQAMTIADLTLIVVRPTFLDIAAAVHSTDTARRLGRPAQIVLNQAYSMRAGREPASVQKAFEALRFTGMPVCAQVMRAVRACRLRSPTVARWRSTAPRPPSTTWPRSGAMCALRSSPNTRCCGGPEPGDGSAPGPN
jgi:chromosome partitioning protein